MGPRKHVSEENSVCISIFSPSLNRRHLFGARMTAAIVLIASVSHSFAANWQSSVTKDPPGNFPPLRPLRASYNFGWSGLTAATADVHFFRTPDNRCQLEGSGRTTGLARALWRYDVTYRAVVDGSTLRPMEANQNESVRSKKMATHLTFSSTGVNRSRTEGPGAGTTKAKQFNFQNLFDLASAMLYLRSQPLKDRSSYRIVVYPNTSAYLATVTVLGREKVSVRAGNYNAIKADLQLSKLGKNLELEPHRKFRRATIWISDDAERLVLRIEAQVFVGTVFAELQSLRFDAGKP
jgi:hypothetical protein